MAPLDAREPCAATVDAGTASMPYAVLFASWEFLRADAACARALDYVYALEKTCDATSTVAPMYTYIQCTLERDCAKNALVRSVRENAEQIHAVADTMLVPDGDVAADAGAAAAAEHA